MSNYVSSPNGRAMGHPFGGHAFGIALVGTPDRHPQPLPAYRDSNGGIWFAGKAGQEYGIEVVVPDTGRYGVLLTVDGLNTNNGKPSSGEVDREGIWVFNAPTVRGANILKGFPTPGGKSLAAFTFAAKDRSYVARLGQGTSNAGVIGARFVYEQSRRPSLSSAPVMRGGNGMRGLGTEFGREIHEEVTTTEFIRDIASGVPTLVVRYAEEGQLQGSLQFRNATPYIEIVFYPALNS